MLALVVQNGKRSNKSSANYILSSATQPLLCVSLMFKGDDVIIMSVWQHEIKCECVWGLSVGRFEVTVDTVSCECVGICWLGKTVDTVSLSVFHCSH